MGPCVRAPGQLQFNENTFQDMVLWVSLLVNITSERNNYVCTRPQMRPNANVKSPSSREILGKGRRLQRHSHGSNTRRAGYVRRISCGLRHLKTIVTTCCAATQTQYRCRRPGFWLNHGIILTEHQRAKFSDKRSARTQHQWGITFSLML